MSDKICPFKCMKVNDEYYCGEWCALYFKSADMCSLLMIANGLHKGELNENNNI